MAYVGVNNVARKISKAYVGVGNVAHKIKKAYVGIGGVARPCFSSNNISYYGVVSPLSVARTACTAVDNGAYALFCGGYNEGTYFFSADAYGSDLTKLMAPDISNKYFANGCRFNDIAMVFGGVGSSGIDAYTTSLGKFTMPTRSVLNYSIGSAATSQYAFIGGGYAFSGSTQIYYDNVDAYSTTYTKNIAPALSLPKKNLLAAASSNYCVFAGGKTTGGADTTTVDVYNNSLTKIASVEALSGNSASSSTAINFNDLLLFPISSSRIDWYDANLTKHTLDIPFDASPAAAASNSLYCLYYTTGYNARPLLFDTSLNTTTTLQHISNTYTTDMSAAAIGNYFLLGGGSTLVSSTRYYQTTMEAYITEGE